MIKNGVLFIKDTSFTTKKIEDPFVIEGYIPETHSLKMEGEGLQLVNRNELRHAVGVVAARALKYFSTNGEGFNVFRTREMAVWWLRHIYNGFSWWKAYVVNAEGERKDMPMLYIGEEFGSAGGYGDNEADIVLSAFENDQSLVCRECKGGVVFAVGYSERGGLFNSPDMYGVKAIVGSKYKGAGVNVVYSITQNLTLMARHALKNSGKAVTPESIRREIEKMKVLILDRPRHNKLIQTVAELGAELILVKDDDLTPTIAIAKNEVDLIIGVGGVPEAVLSAIIIEKLGGEMCIRIIPTHIAQDEGLLSDLNNWDLFKKNEIDILRNFKIVRPGTEKYLESAWNTIWNSKALAGGNDMVFTASVLKKTPWITYPDGKEVPGAALDVETGEVSVQVIRIAHNCVEITPVIYKTAISKFLPRHDTVETKEEAGSRYFELGKAYSEFGAFQKARECLQKAREHNPDKSFLQKCQFTQEYVEGLDALVNKPIQISELLIEHFENACRLDPNGEECHRAVAMIKRFYEYLGDRNYQYRRYAEAIAHYQMALKCVPHDLRLHRKVNSIQMKEIIEEYFNRIDTKYQEYHYTEPPDWKKQKLGLALEIYYNNEKRLNLSCKEPWLIFFRRTALHGERPSYKLSILTKLLQLFRMLNHADAEELSSFLIKEFRIKQDEIESILRYKSTHHSFRSVGKLYMIKELNLDCLSKLLHPPVKVESQNELEDANIPLSISLVVAMEQRHKNILEELKEGSKLEAQEHSYAVAEAYHYAGLALHDSGDEDGAKIYYEKAIAKFHEIIERFEGITPVNSQYRIGNLYEELAMLFDKDQSDYYDKAIEAYENIVDEQKSSVLFGHIRELVKGKIDQAREREEHIEDLLKF